MKKKNKSYTLLKDLVIKKGTRFCNFSNEDKKDGVFTGSFPIGKDCSQDVSIKYSDMDEILRHAPGFFKED